MKPYTVIQRLLYGLLLLAVLALLSLTPTQADQVSLTCTAPTLNTDGTPLTDLAGFRFYESDQSGGPYTLLGESTSCSYVTPDRPVGTYYYVATAFNEANIESDYSGEVSRVVVLTPAPPTELTILDDALTAYAISQSLNALVLYPVGTAPPGTPCDGSMSVNGKYRIPRESVTFAGSVQPYVVVAACGSGS